MEHTSHEKQTDKMQAKSKGACDTKIVLSVKQLKHLNSYYKHSVI